MALGIVSRWSWVPLVAAFGLIQGCSSSDANDDDDDGCSKDTDCINGRVCQNKECVDDPNNGSVLGGSSGSSGSSGTGGTSPRGGSSGTSGASFSGGTSAGGSANGGTTGGASGSGGTAGTAGTAGTSGGSGGTSGSGGGDAGAAGTGGTDAMCVNTDPITCPTADSMTLCIQGALTTLTCDNACTTLGFPVGPCAEPEGCACDFENPTDAECSLGANVLCTCAEDTDVPCVITDAQNDLLSIYVDCHNDTPPAEAEAVRCLGTHIMDNMINCAEAFSACAPAE